MHFVGYDRITRMKMKARNIPLSLYVHTPWCLHKCPYCDFNSHATKAPLPETEYIDALLRDFESQLSLVQGRALQTIFIGGGTPSLLSADSYLRLFKGLRALSAIAEDVEITLEANPGTVEQTRFEAYRAAGINRLSLGVQSFQNKKLKVLERIHDGDAAKQAVLSAQKAGFENFNLDLMFGLPQQSIADGLSDLRTTIDLNPTHISWYQLTLEPHTYFYHKPPVLPDEEMIWELQTQGQVLLAENGYQQYEISAYSKADRHCQHNRNYWQFGDYIGIGAGAHGKITNFETQEIRRRWNHKNPKDYLNKTPLNGEQIVTGEERSLEFMMNALRLLETIPLSLFEERTGLDRNQINASLADAKRQGLLTGDAEKIQLTPDGFRYLNELLTLF